jgi:hypothetical protein
MRKDIWGPAIVIPLIVVPVSLAIFLGIMLFLDFFYDFALALGTILFIAISAGAWYLGRRTEISPAGSNPEETTE